MEVLDKMNPPQDNLKKEIKENWKEKWLIKKESKCWWEKMVDESFDKAYSLAKSKTLKKVSKWVEEAPDIDYVGEYIKQKLKELETKE